MSSRLILPLHCGHEARVEWAADGSLWLIQSQKRLGASVAVAIDAIKQRRIKCARCKRPPQPTQGV